LLRKNPHFRANLVIFFVGGLAPGKPGKAIFLWLKLQFQSQKSPFFAEFPLGTWPSPWFALCLGDLPQEFLLSGSIVFLGLNLHLVWGFASETFKPLRKNLEFGEYTATNMEKYQLHFIQPTAMWMKPSKPA